MWDKYLIDIDLTVFAIWSHVNCMSFLCQFELVCHHGSVQKKLSDIFVIVLYLKKL